MGCKSKRIRRIRRMQGGGGVSKKSVIFAESPHHPPISEIMESSKRLDRDKQLLINYLKGYFGEEVNRVDENSYGIKGESWRSVAMEDPLYNNRYWKNYRNSSKVYNNLTNRVGYQPGDTIDPTFSIEGNKLKGWYEKHGMSADVVPIYGLPDTTKVNEYLDSYPLQDVSIFGHSGTKLGGIPLQWWNKRLNNVDYEKCLLGSCSSERLINLLPDVQNLYYTKDRQPWHGVNPKSSSLEGAMYSIQRTVPDVYVAEPNRGINYDIQYAQGGKVKDMNKRIKRVRMQAGGGIDPMSLAMSGVSMVNQLGGGINTMLGIGEPDDEGLINPTEGALGGAMQNLGYGPVGWAIGAFGGARKAKKANEQVRAQQRAYREMVDPTRASYNPYSPLMPYGGMAGKRVELEKGETYRTPDGKINKISDKAPTHKGGGVPIWLPSGTEVLGKLDVTTKKTFKQLGSKLKKMQDKYRDSLDTNPTSVTANTASLMLGKIQEEYDKLFNEQQSKNGNVIGGDEDMDEYGKGGWIKKAAASIKRRGTKGKCGPGCNRPGCTGRALALCHAFHTIAKNRKKKGEEGMEVMQGGGKVLPGYTIPEGIDSVRDFQYMAGVTPDNIWGPKTQAAWESSGLDYMSNPLNIENVPLTPSYTEAEWKKAYSPSMGGNQFDWQGALTTAGALSPVAYNLFQGAKPAEQLNYKNYLNPYIGDIRKTMRNRRYNIKPTLESNRLAQATYNYNVRQASPTKGRYLSSLQAGNIGRMRADAAAYAMQQNMNNQYLSEQARMDAILGQSIGDTRFRTDDYNLRSEAARRAMTAAGLGQLSQYAQQQQLQRNMMQRDRERMALLPSMIYNYLYNPEDYKNAFSFKTT